MSTGKLLSFQPSDIEFSSEWKQPFSLSLKLTNNSNTYMAFNSRRQNDRNYIIKPVRCPVLPKSTIDLTVEWKNPNHSSMELSNKTNYDVFFELESVNPEVSYVKPDTGILAPKSANKFTVKWKKPITCSLQLSNDSGNYVAFLFTTAKPEKYSVVPNSGIVPPKSTADVTATMHLLENVPLDKNDKFLVQSFVATGVTTAKDLSNKMFKKKAGNNVQEAELKVVYLPPASPELSSSTKEGKVRTSFISGLLKLKPSKVVGGLLKLKPSKLVRGLV